MAEPNTAQNLNNDNQEPFNNDFGDANPLNQSNIDPLNPSIHQVVEEFYGKDVIDSFIAESLEGVPPEDSEFQESILREHIKSGYLSRSNMTPLANDSRHTFDSFLQYFERYNEQLKEQEAQNNDQGNLNSDKDNPLNNIDESPLALDSESVSELEKRRQQQKERENEHERRLIPYSIFGGFIKTAVTAYKNTLTHDHNVKLRKKQRDRANQEEEYPEPEKHEKEAAIRYYNAALEGNSDAMVKMGNLIYKNPLLAMDEKTAADWYNSAHELGNLEGTFKLAKCHMSGKGGVEFNFKEAYELFEQGAAGNHEKSKLQLATLLLRGNYVNPNTKEEYHLTEENDNQDGVTLKYIREKGMKLMIECASAGNSTAFFNLGKIHETGIFGAEQNTELALDYYKKAVEQGNVDALVNMGNIYNRQGDHEKSFNAWNEAAEKKNPRAMNNLGLAYLEGTGHVQQNYDMAIGLFTESASLGNVTAVNNLADIHYSGQGVLQNYPEAAKLYHFAASKGNLESMHSLADMLNKGTGIDKNPKESSYWYKKSAEAGYMPSVREYGYMLYKGEGGLKKNKKEGLQLLFAAAGSGDKKAKEMIDNIKKNQRGGRDDQNDNDHSSGR